MVGNASNQSFIQETSLQVKINLERSQANITDLHGRLQRKVSTVNFKFMPQHKDIVLEKRLVVTISRNIIQTLTHEVCECQTEVGVFTVGGK